eukprot:TRINITY_DN13590_c0_g1_i1.p1 TRINITY_DN13590_c0_g1~~TRINITY_DN13590_c0_g1_i1.p1  ORF type:complete len:167 (+),score=5.23 TRINITY_DN13590_c0_g1_i1:98-598(+)
MTLPSVPSGAPHVALDDLVLNFLDSAYEPVIPDEVIDFYCQQMGLAGVDIRSKRLLSLITQKFLTDTIHRAVNVARDAPPIGSSAPGSHASAAGGSSSSSAAAAGGAAGGGSAASGAADSAGSSRGGATGAAAASGPAPQRVLTLNHLATALRPYGIDVSKPAFYC